MPSSPYHTHHITCPDIRYCNRTPDILLMTMFYTAITSYYGSTVNVDMICIMCNEDWTCAALQYQCDQLATSQQYVHTYHHWTWSQLKNDVWCLILFIGHIFGVTSSRLGVNHNWRPGTWHVSTVYHNNSGHITTRDIDMRVVTYDIWYLDTSP